MRIVGTLSGRADQYENNVLFIGLRQFYFVQINSVAVINQCNLIVAKLQGSEKFLREIGEPSIVRRTTTGGEQRISIKYDAWSVATQGEWKAININNLKSVADY